MSAFSRSATFSPRLAASRRQPTPVMPPPTMSTSKVSVVRRFQSLARRSTGLIGDDGASAARDPSGTDGPDPEVWSVNRGRTPANPEQHQRSAEDQDRDHDRRLEYEVLADAGNHAREHRQSEHCSDDRGGNEQDIANG